MDNLVHSFITNPSFAMALTWCTFIIVLTVYTRDIISAGVIGFFPALIIGAVIGTCSLIQTVAIYGVIYLPLLVMYITLDIFPVFFIVAIGMSFCTKEFA